MDLRNLNKSNTDTIEWYTLAQIEDDKVKFFRVNQVSFSETLLTLTNNIEQAVFFRSKDGANMGIEYYRTELKTDSYYTLSDRVELDKLFVIKVKETRTIKYETSEVE